MSKRFGRNQRRRAREQIAKLDAANVTLSKALELAARDAVQSRHQASRERAHAALLQCQMDAARTVLGESFALPPVEHVLDRKTFAEFEAMGRYRMRRIRDMSFDFHPMDHDMQAAQNTFMAVEVATLDVIEGGIDIDRAKNDAMWREPHAYLRSHGPMGPLAYAVNLRSFARDLPKEEGVRRIAHMLAENMVLDLKRIFR